MKYLFVLFAIALNGMDITVEQLKQQVASLSAQKHQIDHIIAVDNGSIDGSVKLLTNAGIEVIKKSRLIENLLKEYYEKKDL